MRERQNKSVELRLAESGQELVVAIEAAQFARLVDHHEFEGSAEADAIKNFVAAFAIAAERWDDLSPAERAGLLAGLGEHLERLEGVGLFVHWGTSALAVQDADHGSAELPLAVLSISRSGLPTIRLLMPDEMALDAGPGAIH